MNNNFNVHDEYKNKTIDELKGISDNDRLNFSVCLFNLEYDLNIGNCVRSAHILGAKNVYVFGRHRVDARAAVGAKNYTNIIRHTFNTENMAEDDVASEFWSMQIEHNIFPIFIEKTDTSESIYKLHTYVTTWLNRWASMSEMDVCLVFGNENKGIPSNILDHNLGYPTFHIPQKGVIRSLNVASAASIAMYELAKTLNMIE